MDIMTELLQKYRYLTPEIAKKNGTSKFKFYKFIQENGLEQVSLQIKSQAEICEL